eukprot:UN23388
MAFSKQVIKDSELMAIDMPAVGAGVRNLKNVVYFIIERLVNLLNLTLYVLDNRTKPYMNLY